MGLNGQSQGRSIASYEMRIRGMDYPLGTELMEVVTCETVVAGREEVIVLMKNGDPAVIYPLVLLKGTGICGL